MLIVRQYSKMTTPVVAAKQSHSPAEYLAYCRFNADGLTILIFISSINLLTVKIILILLYKTQLFFCCTRVLLLASLCRDDTCVIIIINYYYYYY